MIKLLISSMRKRFDERRRYHQALAEIGSLTQRELSDMRADPAEMARAAYASIYGKAA